MLLPIRIQYYQQAKNPVTLPGEDRWVDKWDVCITCNSAESAAGLKKALLQIDVDVLMGCGTSWLKRKPLTRIVPMAQTKQEPVAWSYWQSCLNDDGTQTAPWVPRFSKFKPMESIINKDVTPLYTTPPQPEQDSVAMADYMALMEKYAFLKAQRTWIGLTEEELNLIYAEPQTHIGQYARAIEAKLKQKNGYAEEKNT